MLFWWLFWWCAGMQRGESERPTVDAQVYPHLSLPPHLIGRKVKVLLTSLDFTPPSTSHPTWEGISSLWHCFLATLAYCMTSRYRYFDNISGEMARFVDETLQPLFCNPRSDMRWITEPVPWMCAADEMFFKPQALFAHIPLQCLHIPSQKLFS